MDLPARFQIGYNKNICVTQKGKFYNVYINDNVFEDGKLSKDKSRSIWLKYKEMINLRDAINVIEKEIPQVNDFHFVYV